MVTQFLTNQVATLFSDIFCQIMLFALVISYFIVVVVVVFALTYTRFERESEKGEQKHKYPTRWLPYFKNLNFQELTAPIDTQS